MDEGIGRIKYFNCSRRFGFVKDYKGGEDLFFHLSRCAETKMIFLAKNNWLDNKEVRFIEVGLDAQGRRKIESLCLAEY